MEEKKKNEIHQYLTFKIAAEEYALNVSNVKEVLEVPKITKVPRMPAFMTGVINLRGKVVPVLDLCNKFGLGETNVTQATGIIVTEIVVTGDAGDEEELLIGIFSDEVQKVITIEPEAISPPPKIGVSINTTFIQGMGHVDSNFIMILNINKILSGKELDVLQEQSDILSDEIEEVKT